MVITDSPLLTMTRGGCSVSNRWMKSPDVGLRRPEVHHDDVIAVTCSTWRRVVVRPRPTASVAELLLAASTYSEHIGTASNVFLLKKHDIYYWILLIVHKKKKKETQHRTSND